MTNKSYAALLRFRAARDERHHVESTGASSLALTTARARYDRAAADLAEILANEFDADMGYAALREAGR